ncbi:MAG: hypothetical protein E3K36_06410 [Candidatus Brocadia sp.]|nr:hypothetical protein [Candidatus Brocadia sp.]
MKQEKLSKDIDLARKIACYIYYKGNSWGFYHVDCLNESDLIEKKLHYFERSTLFLEDFNSEDHAFIKRLDTRINDIIRSDVKPRLIKVTINGNPGIPKGLLIIHVQSVDNLPEYFRRLFDVIELEAEEQDLTTGNLEKAISFPIPPGAKASDIKMVF